MFTVSSVAHLLYARLLISGANIRLDFEFLQFLSIRSKIAILNLLLIFRLLLQIITNDYKFIILFSMIHRYHCFVQMMHLRNAQTLLFEESAQTIRERTAVDAYCAHSMHSIQSIWFVWFATSAVYTHGCIAVWFLIISVCRILCNCSMHLK